MSSLLSWESFIIHLDILTLWQMRCTGVLRIFHYSPWYTYPSGSAERSQVENLSLFTLIYLATRSTNFTRGWESFIIHLDILTIALLMSMLWLRIFHYSPWYTYIFLVVFESTVENLSLFTLIYLYQPYQPVTPRWESFIIHLDILIHVSHREWCALRIFHYSPWYT